MAASEASGTEKPTLPSPTAVAGAGQPDDALGAFGVAIAKAAQSAPAASTDALVTVAFALGWQMAELYRLRGSRLGEPGPGGRTGSTPNPRDYLPGLGALGSGARVEVLMVQVQAGYGKLRDAVAKAGVPAEVDFPPLEPSLTELEARPKAILELHTTLLTNLTAADFRLGKAYGLGRALADTCRGPTDLRSLQAQLSPHRLVNLLGWLDELSTALPAHAAHSVYSSLLVWQDDRAQLAALGERQALALLRRQGELWRSLLSAEKRGSELLEIDNYLDAADDLAGQMSVAFRGVLVRFPGLVFVVLALVAATVLLLSHGTSSSTVAGAGTLLTAFGLTWRGLGTVLGQAAGRLEQPLWGAVMDRAITGAVTLLKVKHPMAPAGALERLTRLTSASPDDHGRPARDLDYRDRRAVALEAYDPD